MEVGSEAGKLSGHDMRRVLLHVLQMTAATALTVAAEQAGSLDLGPWKPFVAVGLTAAIDLVRRWQTSTKVIVEGGQQ